MFGIGVLSMQLPSALLPPTAQAPPQHPPIEFEENSFSFEHGTAVDLELPIVQYWRGSLLRADVTSGSLPPGLELAPAGAIGLTGTPTQVGDYEIRLALRHWTGLRHDEDRPTFSTLRLRVH